MQHPSHHDVPSQQKQLFTGPSAIGGFYKPQWDSVSLEIVSGRAFTLELWHFYETWEYIDEDGACDTLAVDVAGGASDPSAKEMQPREVEEVRAALKGACAAVDVVSLRIRGFQRQELNGEYAEDVDCVVGDAPTWWSTDGRCFLYFDRAERRWTANSVKLAGGDGVRAIRPGGRRAGRGVARSGAVAEAGAARQALFSPDGWLEMSGAGWESASVSIEQASAVELRFHASEVVVEERHVRGREGSLSDRYVGGSVKFRGWGHRGSPEIRVILPPMPDRQSMQEDPEDSSSVVQLAAQAEDASRREGSNFLGDPDAIVLRAAARL